MRSFVGRPGVPLVTVDTLCTADQLRVTLSQEPFGTAAPGGAAPWTIPVCLETRGDAEADSCRLLDARSTAVSMPGCSRWVVGNAGADGYYRTRHNRDALRRLLVANAELAAGERLMLVADEWALTRGGYEDIGPFLQVVRALSADARQPAVLAALGARLHFIHEYVTSAESRHEFERWIRERFTPALNASRASQPETEAQRARRAALLGIVGAIGRDQQVLHDALDAVRDHPADGRAVPADLLDAYVGLAALIGGESLYAEYLDRVQSATTPEERYRYLYALAAFRSPALIRRTLDYALSPRVRSQDRALLIARVLANPEARPLAWQTITAQWPRLQEGVGAFGGTTQIIEGLGAFCSNDAADEIRGFFASHPVRGAERALAQTLDDIRACATLVDRQRTRLAAALATEP